MTLNQPLILRYLPSILRGTSVTQSVLAILGTVLLALSAQVHIPFWPVPTTMQSFTVVLLAALYGRRLGVATIILYIVEGTMGLPVFANSTWHVPSLTYLVSYTGGYFLGFIICTYIIGSFSETGKGKTIMQATGLFTMGMIIIDIPGVAWLAYLLDIKKALTIAMSYQLASLLKIGLGAVLLPILWNKNKFINPS